MTASTCAGAGIDAVDVTGADLALGLVALVVALDAVGRVGEPDRAVRLHDRVVRRIEALALPFVGDGDDRAVELGAADAAAGMLAGNEPPLPVDGVAVGVAAGLAEDADVAARLVVAKDAVVRDIRPDEIASRREPGRALGPPAARIEPVHMRVAVEKFSEARVQNLVVACRHKFPPNSQARSSLVLVMMTTAMLAPPTASCNAG